MSTVAVPRLSTVVAELSATAVTVAEPSTGPSTIAITGPFTVVVTQPYAVAATEPFTITVTDPSVAVAVAVAESSVAGTRYPHSGAGTGCGVFSRTHTISGNVFLFVTTNGGALP
ncbi:hypothetical protein BDM02DRAFT_3193628 [Thelephora ganbajun]|uniref:Uncharacterized protein n=1 Tax=Thelephora ganbajun TaxID=370292 RepID=A0ACB6YXR8_THEGA|nr:hypothetical protein BDM02DRAFT_3193628 [Thelephora ganbajun]